MRPVLASPHMRLIGSVHVFTTTSKIIIASSVWARLDMVENYLINLRKERDRLQQMGIEPTTKAISDSMNIPEEEVVIFSQHFFHPSLSFDSPTYIGGEDARPYRERYPTTRVRRKIL